MTARALLGLSDPRVVPLAIANETIRSVGHYLGPSRRGTYCWADECGALVCANPTSRRLPQRRWLELVRWCLRGQKNGGSQQWAAFSRWLRQNAPHITTVVSYSDPSVGHTGALYRACNWLWAPTWHRLRPPPTGNGSWTADKRQSVKDRWVFTLRADAERADVLAVQDESLTRGNPALVWRERTGIAYRVGKSA